MNALTKTLVVVVTILAVILVALVIPFAARVPDYAQQYRDAEAGLKAQVEAASEDAAKARAEMAEKGEDIRKYLEDIKKLSSDNEIVKSDRTALEAKLAQAENTMARLTAALEVANRVNENKDGAISELNDLVNKQIASLGDQQSQIADLTQNLINVRADNRRLSQNYLRIQEENKALSQRLTEATARVDVLTEQVVALKGDPEEALPPVPGGGAIIRGSVVKIEQVNAGLTFVQLNVGTRDLVKEGMEFTVHRGDEFVGKVQIATVDQAESVGRMTLTSTAVKEGDAVRAGGR